MSLFTTVKNVTIPHLNCKECMMSSVVITWLVCLGSQCEVNKGLSISTLIILLVHSFKDTTVYFTEHFRPVDPLNNCNSEVFTVSVSGPPLRQSLDNPAQFGLIPSCYSVPPLPTSRTRAVRRAPWSMGGPILRKGTHSLQMCKGCTSLPWGTHRAPSQPEAGEKKKRDE